MMSGCLVSIELLDQYWRYLCCVVSTVVSTGDTCVVWLVLDTCVVWSVLLSVLDLLVLCG